MINKETKLFVSVSSYPGDFGSSLYNAAFEYLGVNAAYKPLKCEGISNFVDIVRYAKLYSIKGISVSMPFKKIAVNLATLQDEDVVETGNANTLVFSENDPAPAAYNTDIDGFRTACWNFLRNNCVRSAVVVGSGAVADSIKLVLDEYAIPYIPVSSRKYIEIKADWLINASSVGMEHVPDNNFFKKEIVSQFECVFDAVNRKETNLVKLSRELKKPVVNGPMMCLEGMMRQFSLYTGLEAPRRVFETVMKEKGFV